MRRSMWLTIVKLMPVMPCVFSHRLIICLIVFGWYGQIISLLTVWLFDLSDTWSHGRAKIHEVIDIYLHATSMLHEWFMERGCYEK